MRILFVAMAESVHTARWISQISNQGWEIHLFPSRDLGMVHPDLKNVTVHHSLFGTQKSRDRSVKLRGLPVISELIAIVGRGILTRILPWYRAFQLKRVIKRLQPDIVHTMEIQFGGYLTLEAKKQCLGSFPPWIVTNWGSDIYLFGRLAEHTNKIKAVLAECNYYSCECHRDVNLAIQLGLKGEVLPVLPNSGGFNLERVSRLRQPGPTSRRRLIILKGYQHWAGRALVGLRAIALSAKELEGYRVAIYAAFPDVKIAAELVSQSTGIPIDIMPPCSHDDMLRLYGRSRIYIGLSISDAASTSLLEAMVMGTFPIQSCTACADEWIVDGKSGFIVPPEDPERVAIALRKALSDDVLVDRAAELNAQVAKERINQSVIQPQVIAMYEKIVVRRGRNERAIDQ